MQSLLFLSQRIPYPPDKGEKIRAWNILRHLVERYDVHLGCFHDRAEDAQYIPHLEALCASVCCPRLVPWRATIKSLARLPSDDPLTIGYFANRRLRRWVDSTLAARRISHVFVFASSMAPYVADHRGAFRVLDMVDVDSDKWQQYAPTRPWPMRAIYEREHRTLLNFERRIVGAFDATLFVSRAEADLFRSLAPEVAARIHTVPNGVDVNYFDASGDYVNPYNGRGPHVVFTGAMDYWPNVQAVQWFATEVTPALRQRWADLEFAIVGHNPVSAVRRLAAFPGITVTGRVPDVRPYLKYADVVVAPLKIARGTQNKVLEAMAMARPVIATPEALQGVTACVGQELLVARTADEFVQHVSAVLSGEHAGMGSRARERVARDSLWKFEMLDEIMTKSPAEASSPKRVAWRFDSG
jgi:sugar transferase (PEP-CTERM/EpsH1 system associated)